MSTPRPVKLQLNNSGAWKSVIGFDAGDDAASAVAMDCAEQLGRLDPKGCK